MKGNTLQHCLILGDSRQASLLFPLNATQPYYYYQAGQFASEARGFCFDVLAYLFFFFSFFAHAREWPSRSVERDSSLVLGCHPRFFPDMLTGVRGGEEKKKTEEGVGEGRSKSYRSRCHKGRTPSSVYLWHLT